MTQSPIPLNPYGDDCDDSERFVIFINGGFRSTPTLVFGDGRRKTILTEPTDEEMAEALGGAGYAIGL